MAIMTQAANAPAFGSEQEPAQEARRGFPGLACILCGREGCVSLDLDDLAMCRCSQCEEGFDLDAVREHLAQWQRVLNWVATAPVAE